MSKVVIVTGASGGLGGAIAAKFGARGDRVVLNYRSERGRAEALADEINGSGGQSFTFRADVGRYHEVEAMVAEVVRRWGRIDVLVQSAGGTFAIENGVMVNMGAGSYPIVDMPEEVWDTTLEANLKGAFSCVKAVGPQMIKQRDGHIINIGSGQGLIGGKGKAAYSAAKAGLVALGKVAARELGDFNVRVNTICPGFIAHPRLWEKGGATEETVERIERDSLLHRTNTPAEFADFVVFVSGLANMSGQLLNTDSRILF